MQRYLDQIKPTITNDGFLVAIAACLMIPDICGALGSPDGRANEHRYVSWFDTCVGSKYLGRLDGQSCYGLRCSFLHQARLEPHKGTVSSVAFVKPEPIGNAQRHNVLSGGRLTLHAGTFCSDLIHAAEMWLKTNSNDPVVKANLSRSIAIVPPQTDPVYVTVSAAV